jgi:hypothetical protein
LLLGAKNNLVCEGPFPQLLRNGTKVNSNQYNIQFGNDATGLSEFQITSIDSINGIDIWNNADTYSLLADVSRFKNTPLAIANCNGNKWPFEIESEGVVYLKLEVNKRGVEIMDN